MKSIASRVISAVSVWGMLIGLYGGLPALAQDQAPQPSMSTSTTRPAGEVRTIDSRADDPASVGSPEAVPNPTDVSRGPVQDFKIVDLDNRIKELNRAGESVKAITLSPEANPRKILLAKLKKELEENRTLEKEAEYHTTFAAVARDYVAYFEQHRKSAPQVEAAFSATAQSMSQTAASYRSQSKVLQAEAVALDLQANKLTGRMQAASQQVSQILDSHGAISSEQRQVLLDGDQAIQALEAKRKYREAHAADLLRQADQLDRNFKLLLAKQEKYRHFIQQVTLSESLLGELVKWQNDRALAAELAQRLRDLEKFQPGDAMLDGVDINLVPSFGTNDQGGAAVVADDSDRHVKEIVDKYRTPSTTPATGEARTSAIVKGGGK